VTPLRAAGSGLLVCAIVIGTYVDRPVEHHGPRRVAGYEVLAGDFHVHTAPQTWSALTPFEAVIEAGRQGLDVIAIVPHDRVWPSQMARWFAARIGGPLVLTGEEITTPGYHLLGVGLERSVATNLTVAQAIAEVHRQGGVAIAAHPYRNAWPAYDDVAMRTLDATEVVRPEVAFDPATGDELREFFSRAPLAAIGSSDYHGLVLIGFARTLVFARDRTAAGVLEAIREHHTVAFDGDRAYGDPDLIAMARSAGLATVYPVLPVPGPWRVASRTAGVLGLVAMVFFGRKP
jgi:predicted metal-dependent phosphoesterase TrpH